MISTSSPWDFLREFNSFSIPTRFNLADESYEFVICALSYSYRIFENKSYLSLSPAYVVYFIDVVKLDSYVYICFSLTFFLDSSLSFYYKSLW